MRSLPNNVSAHCCESQYNALAIMATPSLNELVLRYLTRAEIDGVLGDLRDEIPRSRRRLKEDYVDGVQILPADWEKKLVGADVHVKMAVTHQWFLRGIEKSDNYYGEILELHVLRPPRPARIPVLGKRKANGPPDSDRKGKKPVVNATFSLGPL